MNKLKKYLLGREFTWITDCSGIQRFFDTEMDPTHTMQRWKMEMLRFQFTVVHRPSKMMAECDLLSRYNRKADELRTSPAQAHNNDEQETPSLCRMTATARPPLCGGPRTRERTERAQMVDNMRTTSWWTQGIHTAEEAAKELGLQLSQGETEDSERLIITHAHACLAGYHHGSSYAPRWPTRSLAIPK